MRRNRGIGLDNAMIALVAVIFATSVFLAYRHEQAFRITSVEYSRNGSPYRDAPMPFWGGDGTFIINYTTNRESIRLIFFANDCVQEIEIEGKRVYEAECTHCKDCSGLGARMAVNPNTANTIKVKTKNLDDLPAFFIENAESSLVARVSAISSFICLLGMIWIRSRGEMLREFLQKAFKALSTNRYMAAVIILSFAVQLTLAVSTTRSQDVQNWVVWTESLFHNGRLDLTSLHPDFRYIENLYMNKPPGAYLYPFAIIRALFGFSHVYLLYLTRLPPILGTLIAGYAIWDILRPIGGKSAIIAASAYLLNPAVWVEAAVQGKHDALTIAFLLLAVKNLEKGRFPIYFGLSVLGKQFALFCLPWIIMGRRMLKPAVYAGTIFIILALPFLAYNPLLFIKRMIVTHTEDMPNRLSWMSTVGLDANNEGVLITKAFLALYFIMLMAGAHFIKTDEYRSTAIVYCLFILFSKTVQDQYFLWTLPFLLLAHFSHRRLILPAAYVVGSLSILFSFEGTQFTLGPDYQKIWNMLIAVAYLAACIDMIRFPKALNVKVPKNRQRRRLLTQSKTADQSAPSKDLKAP
ncbi:MAG: hypothetical protein V1875_08685 [Candidatus Altiarchaeota archaeon]